MLLRVLFHPRQFGRFTVFIPNSLLTWKNNYSCLKKKKKKPTKRGWEGKGRAGDEMLILQRLYYGGGSEVGRRDGGSLLCSDWADRLMKPAESQWDGGRTCPFSRDSRCLSTSECPSSRLLLLIIQSSIHLFNHILARLIWSPKRDCTTTAPPLDGHQGRLTSKNELRVRDKGWRDKSDEGSQSHNEEQRTKLTREVAVEADEVVTLCWHIFFL